MPAIESTARKLTSAAAVLQNVQETRARLRSAPAAPQAPAKLPAKLPAQIAAPPEPIVAPVAEPTSHSVTIWEIFEIVDAVAAEIGVTREQLMVDASLETLSAGRKIAIALIVIRLGVSPQVAAEHFGVLEDSAREALARVRPIFVQSALPRFAPLAETIRHILEKWPESGLRAHRTTVTEIKLAVCEAFRITQQEIESDARIRLLARARQLGMALSRRFTGRSYAFIGRYFGGKDHSTVHHANRVMAPYIERAAAALGPDATIIEWVAVIQAELQVRP